MQNNSVAEEYLDRIKRKLRVKMDLVFETYLAQDSDFPLCDSPVWVFGRSFSVHYDILELRRTVASCLWVTYRKNFPSLGDTSLTSDKGWGCMIRTGQMVIAKALILRYMGPSWHWEVNTRDPAYLQLISLFSDTRTSCLSLHQIAQIAASSLDKPVGSWLGPNTVAQALNRLLSSDFCALDLQMFISMDSTVVKSDIKKKCCVQKQSTDSNEGYFESVPQNFFNTPRADSKWKPLLLVIPLRLGLSELNSSYIPGIKAVFEMSQNIGIIGGRPNHALYFIGYAENEVLYLDPHTVQPTARVGLKKIPTEIEADESYHIDKPGRMSFGGMDPSIAVCFYCKSESDFDSLCSKLTERFQSVPLPLFEICEKDPSASMWSSSTSSPSSSSSMSFNKPAIKSNKKSSTEPVKRLYPSLSGLGSLVSQSPPTNKTSHSVSLSAGSSPSSSIGRKSDLDDEEFEILG